MKYLPAAILLASISLVACSNDAAKNESHEHNHEVHNHDHAAEAEDSNNAPGRALGLRLNSGEKWSANIETSDAVLNIGKILEVDSIQDTTDYNAMSSRLEAEFQGIFAKCTMTGEAHNQLHHFLVPMTALMKAMGSGSIADRKAAHAAFQDHVKLYDIYFK